jgi:CRISPR-associated protein Cmr6
VISRACSRLPNPPASSRWWFSYGGLGSKARKSFGSLAASNLGDLNLASCRQAAATLRQSLSLPNSFVESHAESPALATMLPPVEAVFNWPNVWDILDQIGFAYEAFAQTFKHRVEKRALGLPHRIGSTASGQFEPTGPVRRLLDEARSRGRENNIRHASPIHIHLSRTGEGRFLVRATAFPAPYLPDFITSRTFLGKFLEHFRAEMARRSALNPPHPPVTARGPSKRLRRNNLYNFLARGEIV